MQKLYAFLLLQLCLIGIASAQDFIWVGGNSNYNNAANWSSPNGGTGVPGAGANLIFNSNAKIDIDLASVTVNSVLVTNNARVALYTGTLTSTGTTLQVTSSNVSTPGLKVDAGSTLVDSTSSDVKFDFLFGPSSIGLVNGYWDFNGNVLPASANGAGFTALTSGMVTINGTVRFNNNSNIINSIPSTLTFGAGSFLVLNKDEAAAVPEAVYNVSSTISVIGSVDFTPAFIGSAPQYGNVVFDLPGLMLGDRIFFPNGTTINGNLQFLNTNNVPLKILSIGAAPLLHVNNLLVSGANTRVVVADEDNGGEPSPGTVYRLNVVNFTQTGGNFSLQEDNSVTGSTTLAVSGNINQTGGTFGVNSLATSASTDLFVLELTGSGAQTISLANNVQNKLTIKMNNAGGGSASLLNALQVARLNLTSGVLTTTSATSPTTHLTILDTDAVNAVRNGSSTSYVNGALRRTTASTAAYVFPTGKAGGYHAVSVIPAATPTAVFEAEYFNTGHPNQAVLPPLAGISDAEYWSVNRVSGTTNAAVQLPIIAPVPRATSEHTIVVARYNGAAWESDQGGNGTFVTPGNASTGTVRSQSPTGFGLYTFGIAGTAALPIRLLYFEANKLNGGARLNWETEDLPVRFEVLRSGNGSNFTSIGTVDAVRGVKKYSFFDRQLQLGVNYYRLRSVEADGTVSISRIAVVINKEFGIEITTLAPNLVRNRTKLSITATRGGKMDLMVTDMNGRNWRRLGITVSPGNSDTWLDFSDLPAGVYQLTGIMNGVTTHPLRFIKQ